MGTALRTPQSSVYGLLVGLGARARGQGRAVLAPEVAREVALHFGALLLTLHGVVDGWAETQADPLGAFGRLGVLDQARVETLDARLVQLACERDGRASALDLDTDMAAEQFLAQALGATDVFAVPLRAGGRPVGAVVIYLGAGSRAPSETDLMALAGLGDVLALAADPATSHAWTGPDRRARPSGFLRRLFGR